MADKFQFLCDAILRDDRDRVKELLKENPSLMKEVASQASYESSIKHWIYAGDSAMHIAAAGCRVEIAMMLLEAGADSGAAMNHRISQPLHYASDGHLDSHTWNPKRQVRMIGVLFEAGSDLHARDKNGATPLHRAVRTRCAAAVECLLDAGSDPTLRNKPGSTAFHLAVQNTGRGGSGAEKAKAAQREIIRSFLNRGISPHLKDAKGKSVLDWATADWIRQILTGN